MLVTGQTFAAGAVCCCLYKCVSFPVGGNWPNTVALWLVDSLTWKTCRGADTLCGTKAQDEVRFGAKMATWPFCPIGFFVRTSQTPTHCKSAAAERFCQGANIL